MQGRNRAGGDVVVSKKRSVVGYLNLMTYIDVMAGTWVVRAPTGQLSVSVQKPSCLAPLPGIASSL